MNTFLVGEHFPQAANIGEGLFLMENSAGYTLVLNMDRPTAQEIKDVSADSPFEIRETRIGMAVWITVKCGTMPWSDCPYTPHLERSGERAPVPDAGTTQGTPMMLVLVDSATNVIKNIRFIGLGNKFSRTIAQDIDALRSEPFNRMQYDNDIDATIEKYNTGDIKDMSRNYFKIR